MRQTQIAIGFTWPAMVEYIDINNEVQSEYGNYVVINDEGWIVTARHVIEPQSSEILYSWWGYKETKVVNLIKGQNDLAFAKLEPFNPRRVPNYPIFGNNRRLKEGTHLFVAGYYVVPENIYKGKLEKNKNGYSKYPGKFDIKRVVYKESVMSTDPDDETDQYLGYYVETYGGFIKSQSGGVLIDRNGIIYGIISNTGKYPDHLAGRSIHIDVLRELMDQIKIPYQSI